MSGLAAFQQANGRHAGSRNDAHRACDTGFHQPSRGDFAQGWVHQSIALTFRPQQSRQLLHIISDLPCACAHTTPFDICIEGVRTSKDFLCCIAPQQCSGRYQHILTGHPRSCRCVERC